MQGDERWTFAALDALASDTARALAQRGVGEGDRVAALSRNGIEYVSIVHAVARLGAALVPLNVRLTTDELGWQLQQVGATVLAYDDTHASTAELLGRYSATQRAVPLSELVARSEEGGESYRDRVDLSATHTIIYTSGTTGRPKGAELTYGNHLWSAVGSALTLGVRSDDRWLACMPLFHVGGLGILMRGALYGITVVLHESFDPAAVNRSIDEDGVTIISVVANMLQRMLEERRDRPYPPTLRCVLAGGGPLPQPLLEQCARRGVPVAQTYGLTEACSQVATLDPADALRKLGSAGKPLMPTELRIVGVGGTATAPGEAGEIVVRGPTVSPGYFVGPGKIEPLLRDGWLRTGDLGYLDDEGYLYVLDRRDDLIISGGENVYPAEVEAALQAHPDVAEAGVVGLPDPRWGQTVVATIVPRPGSALTSDDIAAHCEGRLAPYKRPKRVRFADSLPRNAAGKLVRHRLRDDWTDGSQPG